MSLAGFIICLFFLTLATMFFSVNAITLRIFSRVRLQEAFKALNKEELTEKLVQNAEKLLLSCSLYQLLLNICILLLLVAMFASAGQGDLSFTDYLFSFLIGIVIFSIFTLAIPQSWAKYSGERLLSRSYRILLFFAAVAAPDIYFLRLYDGLIRRLAGVVDSTPEEQHEEFLNGLEQQRIEGVVDQEEQDMIENVLELSDTAADEIMTPRTDIVAVDLNSDLRTILETINNAGHTRVPVYRENIDNIIGFVYAKDLLSEVGKTGTDFKLRDKIRAAYFVPETKPLRTLLREFQTQKLHIAVVLDEYGGTAGIVTLEDILEELVGEIADEYEQSPPVHIRKIDKDTVELDARTYIDDANDQFELGLPEDEDYDTIGGFVFSHLGYIPKTGKNFDYNNLKFTIISAEARRIKRIRIQKIGDSENVD